MSNIHIAVIAAAVFVLLGAVILPLINRRQFKKLPPDQQVLAIMKQANSLIYWKNISNGTTGRLFFVKNKRKILAYPWKLDESGRMLILKENPFDCWDYPEEREQLNEDEIKQARQELIKYSEKSRVKVVFNDPFKQDKTQEKPCE
ncbi:MAG: hypothetical protein LUH82_02325 [Clostridiales bacterium]|nr:hypothetical protein [Clostridiales bacterium]